MLSNNKSSKRPVRVFRISDMSPPKSPTVANVAQRAVKPKRVFRITDM